MAQAARLNLRLQKELKLLMTDPPHGVSLPSLSDNPNLPSVSLLSIEARKLIFFFLVKFDVRFFF